MALNDEIYESVMGSSFRDQFDMEQEQNKVSGEYSMFSHWLENPLYENENEYDIDENNFSMFSHWTEEVGI